MKKLIITSGIIAFIVILTLFLTTSYNPVAKNDENKISVATTIFPIYDIAQNIAGNKITVVNILPPGASPHTFELKPSDIIKLQSTKLIFNVGHGVDNWINDIASSMPEANIKTVDFGIELKKLKFEHEHEEGEEDHQEEIDPHYWLSIENSKIIAENITKSLVVLDPQNQSTYESNLEKYIAQLDLTKNTIDEILVDLPTRNLIVFHEAWNYFAEENSLNIVAVFSPSAGEEPSPQYLKELYDTSQRLNIKAIFTEPQLATQSIQPFVNDLGLTIYTLDPMGGIDQRDSHSKNLIYNATQIKAALNQ